MKNDSVGEYQVPQNIRPIIFVETLVQRTLRPPFITVVELVPRTGVHLLSGTLVAIKVINPLQRPNAERARKLFVREVKLHAVVSGLPGVVRCGVYSRFARRFNDNDDVEAAAFVRGSPACTPELPGGQ